MRKALFVDSPNLYRRACDAGVGARLSGAESYEALFGWITGGDQTARVNYYAALIAGHKAPGIHPLPLRIAGDLQRGGRVVVRPGFRQRSWESVCRRRLSSQGLSCKQLSSGDSEKAVDVWLATDMVAGALRDEYDIAMLVSEDSDFIPAIESVRASGKQVVNAFFRRSYTTHLGVVYWRLPRVARVCDHFLDLLPFFRHSPTQQVPSPTTRRVTPLPAPALVIGKLPP